MNMFGVCVAKGMAIVCLTVSSYTVVIKFRLHTIWGSLSLSLSLSL